MIVHDSRYDPEPDPFPGAVRLGLEVSPAGPCALLFRPWRVEPLSSSPASFGGLLGSDTHVIGLTLDAAVERMSGRLPPRGIAPMQGGQTHLRAFDRDGKMLWRAVFTDLRVQELSWAMGETRATIDLFAPYELRECP